MDESSIEESVALLDQVKHGDATALDRLFGLYRRHLRQMIRSRLDHRIHGRLDASDVVQNTLFEACRRVGVYLESEPVPFGLWLRQIALDQLHKAWRHEAEAARRSVMQEIPLPERSSVCLARQLVSNQTTPSERVSRKEQVQLVRQALAQLSELERELLLMRTAEDLSYEEMGAVLGVSAEAARKRYVRALLRLSRLFHEQGSALWRMDNQIAT
jgi:RNA polymerase sigma-70 factor (ECF subfamily)